MAEVILHVYAITKSDGHAVNFGVSLKTVSISAASSTLPSPSLRQRRMGLRVIVLCPQNQSDLRDAWPGNKYNMVSKNSKHFCDEFLEKLGGLTDLLTLVILQKEAAGTVVKAKDKAFKLVFHPVDFAFNMTTANKNSKAIYSPSHEFRFRFNFAVNNFKVAAPVIRSDH
uniref:Uncharacterized protein n=1 Tax=Solanum tuberosum TaxID=4113 RepID=M1B2E2_SOLTU